MNASILASMAIKGSGILVAAWLISFALRRSSAAARHLVWTAAAAAVIALPWLSLSLPPLRVAAVDRMFAADTGLVFHVLATGRTPAVGVIGAAPQLPTSGPVSPRINWMSVVPILWATGTAIMLLQMFIAYAVLWRKRSAAPPFHDEITVDALGRALGISQPVDVLQAAAGSMPLNFGLLHPVVFLPEDAAGWTEERLRVVLLHELAHVRRSDVATHLLARTALALHWWNPVAWIAWREFLKERERATDDLVLAAGARASEYASHLLEVARSFQSRSATAWAAVAMARQSQLEGRLLSILDSSVRRGAARRLAPLAAAMIAVAAVAPFAALQAQEKPAAITPPEIDATIRAANSQKNHELLDQAASAYISLQRYEVAQTLLEDSLKIRGEVSGEQSGAYATGLIKLADLMDRRRQNDAAMELYKRAATIGDIPEIVPALIHLGISDLHKSSSTAREYFERALRIDPKGSEAGRALTWLGVLSSSSGPVAMFLNELTGPTQSAAGEAESYFQRALAVEKPGSSNSANTLYLYARFLQQQNRTAEAEPLMAQAAAITKSGTAVTSGAVSGAMRVGGGVTAPKLVSKVEPEYSEEARAAKWQGSVLLYVEIQPNGTAQNIRVVRGVGLGLEQKAIEAVQRWKFAPGLKDGLPVTVQAQIEVNFRLL